MSEEKTKKVTSTKKKTTPKKTTVSKLPKTSISKTKSSTTKSATKTTVSKNLPKGKAESVSSTSKSKTAKKPVKTSTNSKKTADKSSTKKPKDQTGIIISTLLIVISILALAGGLGYYIYELNNQIKDLQSDIAENQTRYNLLESQQNNLTNKLQPVLSQLEPQPDPELENVPRPDINNEAWYGDTDADVVIVFYGDPECPFCSSLHDTVVEIVDQEQRGLAMTYRHYPLRSIHPNAEQLSVNLECVRDLSGDISFWSALERVYSQELTMNNFATELDDYNITQTQFENCLDSTVATQARDKIKDNEEYLNPYQVGTPTVALYNMQTNETKTIVGALPLPQFQQELDEFRGR
jgi:protein-disulfide isomerase